MSRREKQGKAGVCSEPRELDGTPLRQLFSSPARTRGGLLVSFFLSMLAPQQL